MSHDVWRILSSLTSNDIEYEDVPIEERRILKMGYKYRSRVF